MKTEREVYMTVGQLAEKMGTTVRTLQYYDREGLLHPSAESAGGRRLYTYRDMITLHQIQSLKSLGFSLKDIKTRIRTLEKPEDVAEALAGQAEAVREKLLQLSETLREIEALREEVLQMREVDFKKYADIIVNLQMGNQYYHLIKHFDSDTMDHIRRHFDKDSGSEFMERFQDVVGRAEALRKGNVPPEHEQAQELAEDFWTLVMDFTGGDMTMLPKLMEIGNSEGLDAGMDHRQNPVNAYLQPALEIYFEKKGIQPFGEV